MYATQAAVRVILLVSEAPNFEAPGDVSGDNVYEVTLALKRTVTVTQDVTVSDECGRGQGGRCAALHRHGVSGYQ